MPPVGRPVSGERLVALRGATTVDADTADAVMGRTSELLSLLRRNAVENDQLVSIIFTSTRTCAARSRPWRPGSSGWATCRCSAPGSST